MATTKVTLNSAGMAELLRSAEVAACLHGLGSKVLDAAKSSAPVRSGTYKASLGIREVHHPSRVVVQVYAGASYAMIVEARSGTLTAALDAAGRA